MFNSDMKSDIAIASVAGGKTYQETLNGLYDGYASISDSQKRNSYIIYAGMVYYRSYGNVYQTMPIFANNQVSWTSFAISQTSSTAYSTVVSANTVTNTNASSSQTSSYITLYSSVH